MADSTQTAVNTAEPATGTVYHANAVLEGGGVRGIGHVGALTVAEHYGYQWDHVAGTSAGAMVAAMLAVGYSANEMNKIMSEVDFSRFADQNKHDLLHVTDVFNFLTHGGLHPGTYLEEFVAALLRAKGIETFGQLIDQEHKDNPRLRYRLTVIASDITTGQMLRLPYDAELFGIDPDKLGIARAVRMSASLPFFYVPINLSRAQDGATSRIVDGGLLSNFPLFLFEETESVCPTIGFRLVDSAPSVTTSSSLACHPTNNAVEIIQALISTMLSAHDRLYMDDHTRVRTIAIPTDGISTTQFNLSSAQAKQLFENGQKAAEAFFSTWDFEAYKAAYLSGTRHPSRRERLHREMKLIQQNAQQASTN